MSGGCGGCRLYNDLSWTSQGPASWQLYTHGSREYHLHIFSTSPRHQPEAALKVSALCRGPSENIGCLSPSCSLRMVSWCSRTLAPDVGPTTYLPVSDSPPAAPNPAILSVHFLRRIPLAPILLGRGRLRGSAPTSILLGIQKGILLAQNKK